MVGRAVGHNPLSIVVPCHRVVGRDGKLTGYAGGLERKHFLLDLEGLTPVERRAAVLTSRIETRELGHPGVDRVPHFSDLDGCCEE